MTVACMYIVGIFDRPFLGGTFDLSRFMPHIVIALVVDVVGHSV